MTDPRKRAFADDTYSLRSGKYPVGDALEYLAALGRRASTRVPDRPSVTFPLGGGPLISNQGIPDLTGMSQPRPSSGFRISPQTIAEFLFPQSSTDVALSAIPIGWAKKAATVPLERLKRFAKREGVGVDDLVEALGTTIGQRLRPLSSGHSSFVDDVTGKLYTIEDLRLMFGDEPLVRADILDYRPKPLDVSQTNMPKYQLDASERRLLYPDFLSGYSQHLEDIFFPPPDDYQGTLADYLSDQIIDYPGGINAVSRDTGVPISFLNRLLEFTRPGASTTTLESRLMRLDPESEEALETLYELYSRGQLGDRDVIRLVTDDEIDAAMEQAARRRRSTD